MATNGDLLKAVAEKSGIPVRTLDQIKAAIEAAKKQKSDDAFARLALKAGRMTDEARAWLAKEYPQ